MIVDVVQEQTLVLDIPPQLIPHHPTTGELQPGLDVQQFGRYFLNSLVVAVATRSVVCSRLDDGLRLRPLRASSAERILFALLLIGLMVPTMMLIIPQFILAKYLGHARLADRPRPLLRRRHARPEHLPPARLLPGHPARAGGGDGRRRRRAVDAYWKLILPLCRPALATVAIFSFLASWDEFVWALTSSTDPNKRTLPIAIALFQGQHATSWGLVFAASVIAVLPVIVIFVDLPAPVRQRPDDGSAEGLMAIATGDLITERSLAVLRDGQARSGAFVASPTFRVYDFGWLRDGSFCAHALDRLASARRAGAVPPLGAGDDRAPSREGRGGDRRRRTAARRPPFEAMLPARYTLEGAIEQDDPEDPWPNFQIDGYGMWLWSLEQSPRRSCCRSRAGARRSSSSRATSLRRGGSRRWSCWEEFQTRRARVDRSPPPCAGLAVGGAAARRPDVRRRGRSRSRAAASRATSPTATSLSPPGEARVDSSILWLGVPFGVFAADDPLVGATVDAVKRAADRPERRRLPLPRRHLLRRRRVAATHLVARLARRRRRRRASARELRAWVRAQARENADLPEQVTGASQFPTWSSRGSSAGGRSRRRCSGHTRCS